MKKYEKDILKVIRDNSLYVITDIFAFYSGCSRKTFYSHELHKSDNIKKAIDENKVKTCQSLKEKWFKSDNPTLQIALFKTICGNDDLRKLAQTYQTIDGDFKINTLKLVKASESGSKSSNQ